MNISNGFRKRLIKLSGILEEDTHGRNEIIISKGHELFHGTGEDFKSSEIRPGAYDEVFWTTEYPAISQSYIPVAGASSYISSEILSKPSVRMDTTLMQKQLGIEYSNVEKNGINVTSYKEAPVFEEISEKYYNSWKKFFESSKAQEEFEKEMYSKWNILSTEEKKEFTDKNQLLKQENETLKREYFDNNLQKRKNDYVNKKLESIGYEPTSKDNYNLNHSWKIKMKYGSNGVEEILPADYRLQGRLLIIIPQEELKIYDTTLGGTVEGSLLEPEYHNINLFRKIENAGYDGIKIPDFAQIENEGNYGHYSIGLFKKALKKVSINEIPAVHPKDFMEKHHRHNDMETDEYKKWKSLNKKMS